MSTAPVPPSPPVPPVPPVPPAAPNDPQSIVVTTGFVPLFLGIAKIIAGLTTERALILFVCIGAGWMFYTREKSQAEDKAHMLRVNDESKERDRRHCDDREERARRDRDADEKEMRSWFATMIDGQRRFEAEQREKDRMAVTELTRAISRKLNEP